MSDSTIYTVTTTKTAPSAAPDGTKIGVDRVDGDKDIAFGKLLSGENGSKQPILANTDGEMLTHDAGAIEQLEEIAGKLSTSVAVTGPLTDAELAARALATETKQDQGNTALAMLVSALNTTLDTRASQATVLAILSALQGALAVTGPLTDAELGARNLATAAKQDTANASLAALESTDFASETTLAAIKAILGIPSSDDLLSLLRDIKANTGTEATTVASLELTAENINLNTDQVEAKLDTIAARIGQAGTAGTTVDYLALLLAKMIVAPATEAKQDTANTALASILAKLIVAPSTEAKQDSMITALNSIIGFIDSVESLEGTGNTTLANILTALQGTIAVSGPLTNAQLIAAGLATEGGNLASILAALGATNGAAITTDVDGTIQRYLRGIVKMFAAGTANVALAASELHIGEVGGSSFDIRSGYSTRPNNTTPYTAGDVITDATPVGFTCANVARKNGGTGTLLAVEVDQIGNKATKLSNLEVWLFNTPMALDADNAPFSPTEAELATRVGIIPLPYIFPGDLTNSIAGNVVLASGPINVTFACAVADKNLYPVLVTRNAYTPYALEKYNVRLVGTRD